MTSARMLSILLVLFSIAPASGQNMIVDGDLENHTSTATCNSSNSNARFNSFYASITAFGIRGGIDIYRGACFGSLPKSGRTKLALAWNNLPRGDKDAMAFDLNTPIVKGQTYCISFWAQRLPFSAQFRNFEIGISNFNTSFGTLVYSGQPASSWTRMEGSFIAPSNARFLTARPQQQIDIWIGVDDFRLTRTVSAAAQTVRWVHLQTRTRSAQDAPAL